MLKRTTVTKKKYQGKRHSSFNPDGSILAKQRIKRAANMCTFPRAILRHLRFHDSELFPRTALALQPEQSSSGDREPRAGAPAGAQAHIPLPK